MRAVAWCSALILAVIIAWLLASRGSRSTSSTPSRHEVAEQSVGTEPDRLPQGSNLIPDTSSGKREPAAATTEPSATALPGVLIVTVMASDTHRGVPNVRLALIPHPAADGVGGGQSPYERFHVPPPDFKNAPCTGADGRASLEAPTGVELTLVAFDEVEQTTTRLHKIPKLNPGEQRDLTIEIPSRKDLHSFALVLARETRQPIVGAFARLLSPSVTWDAGLKVRPPATSSPQPTQATSDAAGILDLWAVSRDSRQVAVGAKGYAPAVLLAQRIDEPEKAQVVFLDRAATLEVRITDAGGVTIEGAFVEVTVEPRSLFQPLETSTVFANQFGQPRWTTESTVRGVGRLEDPPPNAPLQVHVARTRGTAATKVDQVTLEPGERRLIQGRVPDG